MGIDGFVALTLLCAYRWRVLCPKVCLQITILKFTRLIIMIVMT